MYSKLLIEIMRNEYDKVRQSTSNDYLLKNGIQEVKSTSSPPPPKVLSRNRSSPIVESYCEHYNSYIIYNKQISNVHRSTWRRFLLKRDLCVVVNATFLPAFLSHSTNAQSSIGQEHEMPSKLKCTNASIVCHSSFSD